MPWDSWAVLKGEDSPDHEFILALRDSSIKQGEPVVKTSEPMSETKVRRELHQMGIATVDVDDAIARVRGK
jgi:hypothetical protein